MIIVVAEQLAFLKTLFEAVGRKRRFARRQPALGQPQELRDAAGALRHFPRKFTPSLVHAHVDNHFNFERHFVDLQDSKTRRLAASSGDRTSDPNHA